MIPALGDKKRVQELHHGSVATHYPCLRRKKTRSYSSKASERLFISNIMRDKVLFGIILG